MSKMQKGRSTAKFASVSQGESDGLKKYYFDFGDPRQSGIGVVLRVKAHSEKEGLFIATSAIGQLLGGIHLLDGEIGPGLDAFRVYMKSEAMPVPLTHSEATAL